MTCFKILVAFIIAQCCGHHINLQKTINIQHHGRPLKIFTYIQKKWTPFAKIETKSAIQKRELESVITPEEKPPAPVIEHIEELENLATTSFIGFQQPEQGFNRSPLTRSIVPGLNTNIQVSQPQMAGEFYGSLPPRPIGPIPAEPIPVPPVPVTVPPVPVPVPENEIVPPNSPAIVPLPVNTPVQEEATQPALFDKTRVRQYAVYAGDVILKYLSQFFNRARITFNRFTSPPPPTPVYEN